MRCGGDGEGVGGDGEGVRRRRQGVLVPPARSLGDPLPLLVAAARGPAMCPSPLRIAAMCPLRGGAKLRTVEAHTKSAGCEVRLVHPPAAHAKPSQALSEDI